VFSDVVRGVLRSTLRFVAHVNVHVSMLRNDTRIYILYIYIYRYIRNGSNSVRIYCQKKTKLLREAQKI
jgi:hypothetical protein